MSENEPREPDPKRAKIRLQLKNGHECVFTEELPKHLQVECSICLCVLDDPHMIDCKCGASFCQPCIQPTLKEKKPCPLCNSPFTVLFQARQLQRTLNSLQVYCSFKEAGCEWVGELGALSEHLNDNIESNCYKSSGCPFLQLKCCYCNDEFQRQHMFGHETDECLKRPYICDMCTEYESTFEDVTTKHIKMCPCGLITCPNNCGISLQRRDVKDHLSTNCPLEVVSCSFSYAGCEEKLPRKDMPAHISDGLAVHMSLQAVSHQKQLEKLEIQIQKLENEVKVLRSKEIEDLKCVLFTHLRIMPVTLIMNGFAEKKKNGNRWQSESFYSHQNGYKLALSVNCNGYNKAEGTHISVFVSIMHGEFDNELEWPFLGAISIQLLDQEGTGNHFCQILTFDDAPESCTCRVTEGGGNGGWGFPQFISHVDLSRYLKNNSLCFKVSRHVN